MKVEMNYYNAYTKAGNPYRKTNTGKKVCTTIGLGTGAYLTYKAAQVITAPGAKVIDTLKTIAKTFPTNIKFAKSLGAWGLIGLATGAVLDFVVNKVRKAKADKAAQNI